MNMIIAQGYKFNPDTRKHDVLVQYEARTEMEAIRWMNFNRDTLSNLTLKK
jgi:hypothetical protein